MSDFLFKDRFEYFSFTLTWKFDGDSKSDIVLSLKWLTGPQKSNFFWYLELRSYECCHSCFCIIFHSLDFFKNASLLINVVILVLPVTVNISVDLETIMFCADPWDDLIHATSQNFTNYKTLQKLDFSLECKTKPLAAWWPGLP